VKPVFLVVFDAPLNASQSVCEMAGIESLVLFGAPNYTYPFVVQSGIKPWACLKSPRDDRIFLGKVLELPPLNL
jgi:hypothetical protein